MPRREIRPIEKKKKKQSRRYKETKRRFIRKMREGKQVGYNTGCWIEPYGRSWQYVAIVLIFHRLKKDVGI